MRSQHAPEVPERKAGDYPEKRKKKGCEANNRFSSCGRAGEKKEKREKVDALNFFSDHHHQHGKEGKENQKLGGKKKPKAP